VFQIVPLSEAPKRMSCEEKARLVKEYDECNAGFLGCRPRAAPEIGTPPKVEYERLERISSAARVKSEVAEEFRLALVPRKRRPRSLAPGRVPWLPKREADYGNPQSRLKCLNSPDWDGVIPDRLTGVPRPKGGKGTLVNASIKKRPQPKPGPVTYETSCRGSYAQQSKLG
jgi:hypothetical protein